MAITREEWLRELNRLQDLQKLNDDGNTAEEIVELAGTALWNVRKLLQLAFKEGRLQRGTRSEERYDGTVHKIKVYKFTEG